nr:ABC transporter B family member 20 [Tanacetum cinerariifolium]
MNQLEKQLDKENFYEIGSMEAFKVLETQFQMLIKSQIYLDDEYVIMTRNYFLQYTQLEILEFRDTLIQHMKSVKNSIDKRELHKREYDNWVNERQMQTTEENVDTSKALDASLVDTKSSETESKEHASHVGEIMIVLFIPWLQPLRILKVGRAGLSLIEKQKIGLSVARTVLSNPYIILLDEVTSEIDSEAEKFVQEALYLLMLGRSTIIITWRLSLIRNAVSIAMMEEGQLMEIRTHDELIALDGLYAELLRCKEATKLPKRVRVRNYSETATFQIEKYMSRHSLQEPSSLNFEKSPSL